MTMVATREREAEKHNEDEPAAHRTALNVTTSMRSGQRAESWKNPTSCPANAKRDHTLMNKPEHKQQECVEGPGEPSSRSRMYTS